MIGQVIIIFFSISSHAVISLQASDFYVHDLPLLPKELSSMRMHAGRLPVDSKHHGTLFFWHFAKKYVSDKPRTVIWLNGGPGCSSLVGAWMEIGPFRFQDKNTIIENDGSWHLYTNLLFVDQPVGTGFSTVDSDSFIHELDEMTDQFLDFLDQYVKTFPELLQDDIYLAGESFAGQYIPYIAQGILEKRSTLKLRGLLIGNGWIDPVTAYKSYLPFAVAHSLIEENSALYNRINNSVQLCQQALSNEVHVTEDVCDSILNGILMNDHFSENQKGRCVNMYDVRLDDTRPECGKNWPPDLEYITSYLRRKDVMSCIHIDDKEVAWTECANSVLKTFKVRYSKPSITLLPRLLRYIPIILYSGEYDLICNHWGTEEMLNTMTWNDGTGFDLVYGTLAPTEPWMVEGEYAGLIQSARNLTYILFFNASHRVPYNHARRSRIMLHQFMQLNLTSFTNEIMNIYQNDNRIVFIIFAVIIGIVVLIGLTWFFMHKQYQTRIPTTCSIIHILRSKKRTVDRQQWMVYSLIDDSNETSV